MKLISIKKNDLLQILREMDKSRFNVLQDDTEDRILIVVGKKVFPEFLALKVAEQNVVLKSWNIKKPKDK